jgi:hypothetical protein
MTGSLAVMVGGSGGSSLVRVGVWGAAVVSDGGETGSVAQPDKTRAAARVAAVSKGRDSGNIGKSLKE